MSKTSRPKPVADEIGDIASRGDDVSRYFTNQFTVVRPVRRVNVDLTQGMLRELEERAARLNISRQAVIKTLLERALDEERVLNEERASARTKKIGKRFKARLFIHADALELRSLAGNDPNFALWDTQSFCHEFAKRTVGFSFLWNRRDLYLPGSVGQVARQLRLRTSGNYLN